MVAELCWTTFTGRRMSPLGCVDRVIRIATQWMRTINLQLRASIDIRKAEVFMGGWIVTVAECSAVLA